VKQFDAEEQRAAHFAMLGVSGPVKMGAKTLVRRSLEMLGIKAPKKRGLMPHEPMSDEQRELMLQERQKQEQG